MVGEAITIIPIKDLIEINSTRAINSTKVMPISSKINREGLINHIRIQVIISMMIIVRRNLVRDSRRKIKYCSQRQNMKEKKIWFRPQHKKKLKMKDLLTLQLLIGR